MEKLNVYNVNFKDLMDGEPGLSTISSGPNSGEEFKDILLKLLQEYDRVEIDGSDIETSFNPSFITSSFGVVRDILGSDEIFLDRVLLFSRTNPKLKEKFIIHTTKEPYKYLDK